MEENRPSALEQNIWAPPPVVPQGNAIPAGTTPAGANPAWAAPAGAPPVSPTPGNWAPPAEAPLGNWAAPTETSVIGTASSNLPFLAPGPTIIDTDSGRHDGLNRCPRCGGTDIWTQPGTGMLTCNFCRAVFELGEKEGSVDVEKLVGEKIGSGAANITQPENTQVTIKCQGCGAEVVIDVNATMTSRCHWCRQMLSIEHQIPNGAVPDLVLPFLLSREQAQVRIQEFVKQRAFFAHPKFKREFTAQNIIGVFLPYLVIDVNAHCDSRGTAGHIVREHTVGIGKDKQTYYDIDVYNIGRDFDLIIDDLTIEASSDKRNVNAKNNTNNVINTILPFDIQNALPYNGNYLKGFNSERRDTNINDLRWLVDRQVKDIARYQANGTAAAYSAGIAWVQEDIKMKGILWKAAYLPVWLYSYYEIKGSGARFLHYVAVNARTGETMGSVPMNTTRLVILSAIVEAIALAILGGFFFLVVLGS